MTVTHRLLLLILGVALWTLADASASYGHTLISHDAYSYFGTLPILAGIFYWPAREVNEPPSPTVSSWHQLYDEPPSPGFRARRPSGSDLN